MTIGERIKERRKELGISVDELAARLGKNRATIYRYESNEIEKLPTTVLEPLAKALGVSPGYLMGWKQSTDGSDSTDSTIAKEDPPLDKTESEILILARKTKDLPESDRKKLVKIFESSINTFLEAQNKDD